jgi:transcriptional repressor NrdR
MHCIHCSHPTKVTNSRQKNGGFEIWRRRQCLFCKKIFTTFENPDLFSNLLVEKRSGTLEPFVEAKVLISIAKSLSNEPNAPYLAQLITKTITKTSLTSQINGVITSDNIYAIAKKLLSDSYPKALNLYLAHSSVS